MPPTATELKARLDKAVDQEGNVLDMEAVLEIVTYLEKNMITKEALETTRIGRTINTMRKKTTNKELAKRAKKLIQKWSNSLQRILKADSPLPTVTPIVNGIVKRLEHEITGRDKTNCCINKTPEKPVGKTNCRISKIPENPHAKKHFDISSEHITKPSLKRKRTSGDILTPDLSSKPAAPSPNLNHCSPQSKFVRTCERIRPISPLTFSSHTVSAANTVDLTLNNKRLKSERTEEVPVYSNASNSVCSPKKVENGHKINSFRIPKDGDTRCQEDRAKCSENKTCLDTMNISDGELKPKLLQSNSESIKCETFNLPRIFAPIAEEDLAIIRKELPENSLSPDIEADGVNGVYNNSNTWTRWTDTIPQRNNELHLLPYVILD